jgi:hypothetical protein
MSLEPRQCLHCPHHPSSPLNPRDIYIGHHYSLFISPDCTHSSIQQLDDHYPQPPASEDTTTAITPISKKTHTYAHCSRCNLILDYDVWGCGCDGFLRSEAGIGGGIHDVERILYTPGHCSHCAKLGLEPETACEPERCVRCMEIKSDEICGTRP